MESVSRLTPSSVASLSCTLEWGPPLHSHHAIEVQYCRTNDIDWAKMIVAEGSSGAELEGLSPGSAYRVRVRVHYAHGVKSAFANVMLVGAITVV